MFESLLVTLALCQQPLQNVRPEFSPNPPRRVEKENRRPKMTLDIFVEMIRRGDQRADMNKDGKINGKDLEIVLERKMKRTRGMENRPHSRQNRGCRCKNK